MKSDRRLSGPPGSGDRKRGDTHVQRTLLTLALAVIVVSVLAVSYVTVRDTAPIDSSQRRVMLAVLPFRNLTASSEKDYLSEGITEELITRLSGLRPSQLGVIAPTSAMKFKDSPRSIRDVGRALNVGYVLEGTVRASGDRVRFTAHLIRVSDETAIWSQSFDRELEDVLYIQKTVTEEIASALSIELLQPTRLAEAATVLTSSEAYDAYLKGRFRLNRRTEDDVETSRDYFARAIGLDPFFVPARVGLAEAYIRTGMKASAAAKDAYSMARTTAEAAVELQPGSAEAHVALALASWYADWDWSTAGRSLEQAISINPGLPEAHHWYGYYLTGLGQHGRGIAEIRLARQLDPLSRLVNSDVGWFYYFAGQHEMAVQASRRTLELDPGYLPAHACLVASYSAMAMSEQAFEAARKWMAAGGADETLLAPTAELEPEMGMRRIAEWWLTDSPDASLYPYEIALLHLRLGEKETSLTWLETAYRRRDPWLPVLRVDPRLTTLRTEPRFKALLRRLHFPPF